ncbi:MAG: cytochrome C peroxidase [Planctomycetaceae bacterium]|nr:cytochrome C peroxidase [Planctomycetaceae bacterium]
MKPRVFNLACCTVLAGAATILLGGCRPVAHPPVALDAATRLRHPVALEVVDQGRRLLVCNRRSGSISLVDLKLGAVVAEADVADQLSDLAHAPQRDLVVTLDDQKSELITLRQVGLEFQPLGRVAVPAHPVSVVLLPDAKTAFVASLWARQLSVVDLTHPAAPRVVTKTDLPFPPRKQYLLPGGSELIVADAFGGGLVVIDPSSGRLLATQELNAHNLRGLAVAPAQRELLVSHQTLMSENATTEFDVHWGTVMVNVLEAVPLTELTSSKPRKQRAARLTYLGTADQAAGDPDDVLVTSDGHRVVALAGTSEVAIYRPGNGDEFERVTVGRRPTALALNATGDTVIVANMYSDSLSLVDLKTARVVQEISLGPQPELTRVDWGERWFHDASLSSDGWFSCHSCHTDGHSNGRLNDNFGDGGTGAPKRVLALSEVAHTAPWAWNGKMADLSEQVRKSIKTTMRGPDPTDDQVAAIAAYLGTLRAPPSLAASRGTIDRSLVAFGKSVFQRLNCVECHRPPYYTTPETYTVDIAAGQEQQDFNPPSLLGVSQRRHLFHDNRASDLKSVLVGHNHGLEGPLIDSDLKALLAFLQSL